MLITLWNWPMHSFLFGQSRFGLIPVYDDFWKISQKISAGWDVVGENMNHPNYPTIYFVEVVFSS